MTIFFAPPPLLAAVNITLLKLLAFAVVLIVGSIVKRVNEAREQAEKMKAAQAGRAQTPAPPRRENQFRNEIEAFLDEVGRRRTNMDASQRPNADRVADAVVPLKARPLARPESPKPPQPLAARNAEFTARGKTETVKNPPAVAAPVASRLARPGAEIAARKAPVSADLGSQVRSHLSQYLDPSRMGQTVRSDLGNAIERNLIQHLGETVTRGADDQPKPVAASASQAAPPPLAMLLNNPAGARTAIAINEILGRPRGLQRRH